MVELNRIQLYGFKSIREMDLELRDLNILIGANGSGKSNFLSFFRFLNLLFRKGLQVYVGLSGGADVLLHFGHRTTEFMGCRLLFECGAYSFRIRATATDRVVVTDEEAHIPDARYPVSGSDVRGGYADEANLPDSAARQKGCVADRLVERSKGWLVYHFADTSVAAKVRKKCDVDDNVYLRPDGSNLASFLFYLHNRHEASYSNIVDAIRMVAPFFGDFDLRPDRHNESKIQLEWREKGSDAYFGPEALSDGTLRFACLATLLLQPEPPSLIEIDEPELGLHPAAITLVASMMKSAAVRTQVIACTQSVTLVNQFEPADVVVVDREEGQSVFRRLTEEQVKGWLDEYALGDLWEKNIIGGRP